MRCERGQASVEWVGLVLLVAAALGALIAFAPEVEGRSLGAELAGRILPEDSPRTEARAAVLPAPRSQALRLAGVRRIAGAVAKRAWIACLGYRRYRYEREHPARLAPFDRMPLRDAVRIADDCLNPVAFLRDEPRP